ncbi:PLDc N-terminal domain-containing protein [Enterococcus faecium]|jgi:hypothetical protein|uniref:Cardiolipin synthase N-terminal domain-containing protein n=1 Tax=Enterococcus faecium TaxID=1352 RepID=A0A242BCT7_ENTFC|nr:PLDc N-terminal domain-containing protein [Enterococcus faecium]EGP5687158.1 hypothetical protein [Enterococcus faecium]EME8087395.1 PLDc N-terminal domain-containing protein [Enterococcus faecium]EME8111204.1 PLDc N-terminal domain-containing protein [Enterococcus faecium]EME8197496.1 PLDc N-terminal domain-containing protein [Enterococcus faecium]KAA0690272.1 hypothetical protein DTX73_08095 [Enterococcus faecium]
MGIKEFLPFLIPLIIVQFGLLIYVLQHIFTHSAYKHGNRMIWVIIVIVGMQFIGPVLYLIFGKEDA